MRNKTEPESNQMEMLKLMYQSYSGRDSNKVASLFSLITGLTVIFSGYGWLFMKCGHQYWYQHVLIGLTIVANLAMCMFYFVALNFGYTSTKEHHMLHIIQRRYGVNSQTYKEDELLSAETEVKTYGCCNFIPDFYQGMLVFIILFQFCISVATCYRLVNWWVIAIPIVFLILQLLMYKFMYGKYLRHVVKNQPQEIILSDINQ